MPRTAKSTRPPLNRERVLAAAIALADREGIDGLSMRRLGQDLGVEAMSLYNHVQNKDAILLGIVDAVLDQVDTSVGDDDWKATMRRTCTSLYDVLMAHPWVCALLTTRIDMVGPARLRKMEAMLRPLRTGGFSVTLTHHAFHVLDTYVVGFASQEANFPVAAEDVPTLAVQFRDALPADEYPHLLEHVDYHLEIGNLSEGDFAFGLDLILDGLDRLRDAG